MLLSKLGIRHDRIPYLNVYYTTANMPLTSSGETRVDLRERGTDEGYVLLGTRIVRPYGSSGENYFYNIETCGALVFLQNRALVYINSDFESIVGGNQIGIFYGIFKYNS